MNDITTQTPLERWSNLIRTRAENRITRMRPDQSVAEALMGVVKAGLGKDTDVAKSLNLVTVEAWLKGDAAPESPRIHEALLRTLGLSDKLVRPVETESKPTIIKNNLLAEQLAAAMQELEALNGSPAPTPQPSSSPSIPTPLIDQLRELYASIPETAKHAVAIQNGQRSRVVRTQKLESASEIAALFDSPYIPERVIINPTHYAALRIQDCTEKMSETSNVHEFLTLYRLHRADDIASLAHRMQIEPEQIADVESGKALPDTALLAQYKRIMKPNEYSELEDVLIANRLAVANGLRKERDTTGFNDYEIYNQRIADMMEELPSRYWKAALEKHNNPRQFRSKSDSPWIDQITKIEYKEDYLRAARGYLGLSRNAAAQTIGKDSDFIYRLEDSMENGAGTNAKKLATSYRKQMAAEAGLFDLGKYDKLVTAYDPELAREAKAEAKAAQRESKEFIDRAAQPDTSRSR